MHPENTPDPSRNSPASTLAAEICARLLEWRDTESGPDAMAWLVQLVGLYHATHIGAWLYVAWQTGSMDEIGRSYQQRADAAASSRQAIEQTTADAMQRIAAINPELARAMRETFEAVSPEAHADRYTQAEPRSAARGSLLRPRTQVTRTASLSQETENSELVSHATEKP